MLFEVNHKNTKHFIQAIHNIVYCLFVVIPLTFTGCIRDKYDIDCDKHTININPTIAGGRVTGNSFDAGDRIGLYAAISPGLPAQNNYVNNIAYIYNGSQWTPDGIPSVTWPGTSELDIYAYWPYDATLSSGNPLSYPFTLHADQRNEENYLQNDFLWANAPNRSPGETVPLLFTHLMSRVKINVHSTFNVGENWPEQAELALLGLSGNMTIDLSDGSVTPDITAIKLPSGTPPERTYHGMIANAEAPIPRSEEDVFPLHLESTEPGYELSLAAILMPQDVRANVPLIRIDLEGKEYVFLPENDFTFVPGENLTLNLTLVPDLKPRGIRGEPDILSVDENGILNLDGRGHIVYFKWGSSVAVFGRQNGYVFAGKSDIAWTPPEFDIESITGTGDAGWAQINFSTNPTTYPDRTNPTDIARGLGDPCQFAVKDGQVGNYRIPNGIPYEQFVSGELVDDYNGVKGRWSDYGTVKSQFYPFAGRILDGEARSLTVSVNYWSNTGTTANEAYSLSLTSSVTNPSSTLWRDYGLPVRCVRK